MYVGLSKALGWCGERDSLRAVGPSSLCTTKEAVPEGGDLVINELCLPPYVPRSPTRYGAVTCSHMARLCFLIIR